MDRSGIKDRDLVLVLQQATANDGKVVVALIDDKSSTKEFRRTASAIVLTPRSSSPASPFSRYPVAILTAT
ncbi:MAG: hypothetical protein IPQ00_07065 [Chloracidobacterium sp.]|nr:hypothetical protein [Chloracidobacterium sp.]